jgi:hypothetical protein
LNWSSTTGATGAAGVDGDGDGSLPDEWVEEPPDLLLLLLLGLQISEPLHCASMNSAVHSFAMTAVMQPALSAQL